MKYPAYPRYKVSGIEWLGKVPENWQITRVKYCSKFQTGWTPPTGRDEFFGGDNLWANISDLGKRVIAETGKRISDKAVNEVGLAISPKGSLLFSFKLSIGQVSFAGVDLYTNEAIASFLPDGDALLSFLYYALPIHVVRNANENIYGAKLLNQELIKNAAIVLPSKLEQMTIANFLDHETAKIDALIARQERLIELLREKRQSIISHAVTKGLNPSAPMRDSGTKWLGEIPTHWGITRLKYATSHIVDCHHSTPNYLPGGAYPAVRTADVTAGRLHLSGVKLVSVEEYQERISRLEPKLDDILYSREGERFGIAALIPSGTKLCLGQRMMLFRVNSDFIPAFCMWQLNGEGVYNQAKQDTIGATSPHVNVETIQNFWLTQPPKTEQSQVSDYLDQTCTLIDKLEAAMRQQIRFSQEHRSALITAAVTGRIDVRQYVD